MIWYMVHCPALSNSPPTGKTVDHENRPVNLGSPNLSGLAEDVQWRQTYQNSDVEQDVEHFE